MKKICIVGPMLGNYQGHKPTPGETLAHFLRTDYSVLEVSHQKNRFMRLFDILNSIWINRNQINLLIIQIFGHRSFIIEDLASTLGKHLGIPIIMVLHGGSLPKMAAKYPKWVRRVFRRADALIAPSAFLSRELCKLGVDIQIIPNIIDIKQYPFHLRSYTTPFLFWMRTFEWYYNPTLALKVLQRILKFYPNARLTMAGSDTGLLKKVKNETHKMGLDSYVSFPGMLNLEEKIRFVANHDVFLNTNLIDNMPVTLIEMAALGIPIISTTVGGIPDLIENNKTGILVQDNDDEAMANAVIELIDNPCLTKELSEAGRLLSEKFSWEATRSKWERLINELSNLPKTE